VLPALEAWTNFYVIVGSSAGALTGLQFVVVALVADTHNNRAFARTASAFATPTVVHFSIVLVLSGIFAAPWRSIGGPMVLIGSAGAGGFIYTTLVAMRAAHVSEYRPVAEDWIFHVLLPAFAYATMTIAAITSRAHAGGALFAVAGSALLLLIIGIHNAWDTVTFIVAKETEPQEPQSRRERERRSTGSRKG
jgi:hypothetical protein